MASLGEFLKKWWIPAATILLATSPSVFVLSLQNTLSPYVAALEPKTLIEIGALLLWLCMLLLAFVIGLHPWLKWDEPTGTWVNFFTGLRYCGTCRAMKIIVPLKNEITGWRCVACKTFRTDPKRKKEKTEQQIPSSRPSSWMSRSRRS